MFDYKIKNDLIYWIGKLEDALKERLEYELKYGRKIEGSIKNSINNMIHIETTDGRPKRDKPEEKDKEENEDDVCPPCEQRHGIPAARFMEILIVVDHRLEKFFEHDLETFLFTIFNMVIYICSCYNILQGAG